MYLMKIILEVENANYLDSDFHITCFLSVLKEGGEKMELHFLPYSKQANVLKLPLRCRIFHFTFHKKRMCSLKYTGLGLISIHWERGLYFVL